MNSKEFAYWLKGAIELSHIDSLDKFQTESLKNYIKIVDKEGTSMSPFTLWLTGYLDLVNPVEINKEDFRKIHINLYKNIDKINEKISHLDKNHDMSVYPPGVRPKC